MHVRTQCTNISHLFFSDQQGVMTDSPTIPDVTAVHNDVTIGGSWKPKNCIARHRVAIVIPYRDRQRHLTSLLNTLVPVLKSQNVHFQIFVSEQVGTIIYYHTSTEQTVGGLCCAALLGVVRPNAGFSGHIL